MSKRAKPNHELSGEQASAYQRTMAEICNYQIEYNREQAIAKSPQVFADELICFTHIPKHIMQEIEKAGLSRECMNVPPKTQWQAPRTGDKLKHLLRWISRYDKVEPYRKPTLAV